MSKIGRPPLYKKARNEILQLIAEKDLPDRKLPSEKELSEYLGISRSTVREALRVLEKQSFISKKQGVGNLFNESVLNTSMRIDLIKDFNELLENEGYEVNIERLEFKWVDEFPKELVENFSFENDSRILLDKVCYYADGNSAILAYNLIPETALAVDPFSKDSSFQRMKDFLNRYACEEVSHSITKFLPCRANDEVKDIFSLTGGECLVTWEECFYGIFDSILSINKIYFQPNIVELCMVRNWS